MLIRIKYTYYIKKICLGFLFKVRGVTTMMPTMMPTSLQSVAVSQDSFDFTLHYASAYNVIITHDKNMDSLNNNLSIEQRIFSSAVMSNLVVLFCLPSSLECPQTTVFSVPPKVSRQEI